MIIVDGKQGTEEWHQLRLGVISMSNASLIITPGGLAAKGKTRDDYIVKLAKESLTGVREDSFMSADMKRGVDLEPAARAEYEFENDVDVHQVSFVYLDDEKIIGCSPDGLINDDGGVEFKCPKFNNHYATVKSGEMPKIHKPQVQGNMWVCGREWWDFNSYYPEFTGLKRRIYRDDKYIKKLERLASIMKDELFIETERMRKLQWQ